jgi:branched-chain amino acid transport system ATP-binding protein
MARPDVSAGDRWPGDVLRATGVSRHFEGVHAHRDVSTELHRHEVVGLIGPNGAGKTTLVNVLTGFDFPTDGSVELSGQDVTSWSPHRRGRAGLARTFQHSRSFAGLSVRENVEVAALGSQSLIFLQRILATPGRIRLKVLWNLRLSGR